MDDVWVGLLTALPNFAVAIWVLWRDDKRISTLLEQQRWLIEQLMALHPPQDKELSTQEKQDLTTSKE